MTGFSGKERLKRDPQCEVRLGQSVKTQVRLNWVERRDQQLITRCPRVGASGKDGETSVDADELQPGAGDQKAMASLVLTRTEWRAAASPLWPEEAPARPGGV